MTIAKTKRVKEALQGLVMDVQAKEGATAFEHNLNIITFLQLEDKFSPT